ncbi:MAG: hypothetical protein ACI9R3_000723 [Verrucomicrobiales bacterium]|jgi:hypothetical protein
MMRTFFNRPLLITFLMLIAGLTYLFLRFDGFQKRHIIIPELVHQVKFREDSMRRAFELQSVNWLQQNGYVIADGDWQATTGKAAFSQGTGVRKDLQVYIKKLSGQSYQAWGIGPLTENFKLVQVYRAMVVSEWTQEKADRFRDDFKKDAARLKNLTNLGIQF